MVIYSSGSLDAILTVFILRNFPLCCPVCCYKSSLLLQVHFVVQFVVTSPLCCPVCCNKSTFMIVFTYEPLVKTEIEVAKREVEEKVKTFGYKQQEYTKYGRKYLKTQRISPDAVAQLAYQVRILHCITICLLEGLIRWQNLLYILRTS